MALWGPGLGGPAAWRASAHGQSEETTVEFQQSRATDHLRNVGQLMRVNGHVVYFYKRL